jgi:hypothetical protein
MRESKVCCLADLTETGSNRSENCKITIQAMYTLIHSRPLLPPFHQNFSLSHFLKRRADSKDVIYSLIFDGDVAGSCIGCRSNLKYCQRKFETTSIKQHTENLSSCGALRVELHMDLPHSTCGVFIINTTWRTLRSSSEISVCRSPHITGHKMSDTNENN